MLALPGARGAEAPVAVVASNDRPARGPAGEGADSADRRRGQRRGTLRREARRHAGQDRCAAWRCPKSADGAQRYPQPPLHLRRPGAGARQVRARGAAGRSGSAGGSGRVRDGAGAGRGMPKPPSRSRSARPRRSVRRWSPGTQAADWRDPADYSVGDDDKVMVQAAENARPLRRMARRARAATCAA